MRRPLQAIGISLAVLSLLGAGLFAYGAHSFYEEYRAGLDAPLNMQVDLSRPGVYRGALKHTCRLSHGEELRLEIEPVGDDETPSALIAGLSASAVLASANGEHVLETSTLLSATDDAEMAGRGIPVSWLGFARLPRGEYELVVSVAAPATRLAGRKQLISGKYLMCGAEVKPAICCLVVSASCLVAFLLSGGLTLLSIRKSKRVSAEMRCIES